MTPFNVRPVIDSDRGWVAALLREHWASTQIVTRGKVHRADTLPGVVAERGKKRLGLVTYRIVGYECEIVSLNSLAEGIGVGAALVNAVRRVAADTGCRRLWVITTNDNTHALRFYQKRGFSLVAVHCNVIEQWRRLKPEIPEVGIDGIRLRDEIELEFLL